MRLLCKKVNFLTFFNIFAPYFSHATHLTMKKTHTISYFVFFIIFLIFPFSCSQKSNKELSQEEVRTDTLITFYRTMIEKDPAEAKQSILEACNTLTDSTNHYKLVSLIGICHFYNNNLDSAFITNRAVIDFCNRQKKKDNHTLALEGKALNDIGIFFQIEGQIDSAIVYLQKAINAIHKTDKKNKLPSIYINLADNYTHLGNFSEATSQYRKALLTVDSLQLGKEHKFPIYSGLGRIYTDLKNFQMADYYYKKVESDLDSIPLQDQYFFSNSRGNYYYNTKEYASALPWFRKANSLSKQLNQRSFEAITEGNLGEIFLLLNQPDSARFYLDKAGDFFLAENAPPASAFYIKGLYASFYLQTGKLDKAEKILSTPYDKSLINPIYIYFNDKRQEELYRERGEYKKAYEYGKKAQVFDDSLRNVNIQNNIAEIDSHYRQDTTLLKQEILISQKEQKVSELQTINLLIVSLLIISTITAIFTFIYIRRKRELQYSKQMATMTKLRMENVRNRISPHFMFNILNSTIPSLRDSNNKHNQSLEYLVQLIRGNLLVSEKMAVHLEEEINIVKNYLALLGSIGELTPRVEWDINPNVNMQALLPSMILQIPVENAVEYAFADNKTENQIKITINSLDKKLHITIEDNGVGYNPGKQTNSKRGTGNGLKILYKTIEILNIKNQQKIEFNIENGINISSEQQGTKVFIGIPLDYKYDL